MAECQECGKSMYGDKCLGCGWDRTKDAAEQQAAVRKARATRWADLVKRQEEAKHDLWRVKTKARDQRWPHDKLNRVIARSEQRQRVCTHCAAGKVVVERYDPALEKSARRRGWDPIMQPTSSVVVLCDRKEPATGERCRLGRLLSEAQPRGSFDYGGDWTTLSEAVSKGWEVPKLDKAEGTIQQETEADDLSVFDELEIPL